MQRILNYIGGELVPPQSQTFLPNYEPATGQIYSEVPQSGTIDVEAAIHAAEKAFPAWSALSADNRSAILRRIAEGVRAQRETLALAESVDNGKPLSTAGTVDIPRSAQNLSFFADAITQFSSECHVTHASLLNFTLRNPLGIVGCISPWNLPLYLLTWKIAPALAAGNCVIAKPSEITPMTAFLFSRICIEAGLPPGVLNIVHGLGSVVGAAITQHSKIKAISFTGSSRTGAEIVRVAGPTFKKLSLEMGGKNPTLVFADCDFDRAVQETVRAAFSNQGQICLAGSRILVHQSIYERFKTALIERISKLKVGDPLDPATDQGAVVSREHFQKILSCLDHAREEGGKFLAGGHAASMTERCKEGWFIQPTLIEGLSDNSRTNQEEIFGPVATLAPFSSEEEALEKANSTRYGLAASVWTQNLDVAHRTAARLHAGMVWINCWMMRDLRTPFGGTKDSGVGREGGWEALRFFTESKNVCLEVKS